MQVSIENSWKDLLEEEFEKEYFTKLIAFIKEDIANHKIFPPRENIFSAFDFCKFPDTRIVILGQDPYHGAGQANGLCFSVSEGVKSPPSLVNIFKEVQNDLGKPIPESGNLERWARQGVLLLNSVLTVRTSSPGSHRGKGWELFTDAVIKEISDKKENVVFLLWGAYAQKKGHVIDQTKHYVLQSPHPSPFSVNRGFFGSKHFSKANNYLKQKGFQEVDW